MPFRQTQLQRTENPTDALTQLKSRIYLKRKSKHLVSYKAFIKVNWKLSVSSNEKFQRYRPPSRERVELA